ncbi:MAG: hypothetical protein NCW75_03630 [Phycisphaera sp.]|nr:MAG: hypothetical protein NCW75_03630 [Phycisphaera sp.]
MPTSLKPIARTLVAILAAGSSLACAQEADEVSQASLITETTRVTPGQTLLLGLHFDLKDKWHIYWDGRNDTGFAPTVEWTLPEGVKVGPMLWPAPHRYESPGEILDHVYEGRPTILIPVTIEYGTVPGTKLEIAGEVEWLVCNDICLPGFGPVSIDLDVVRMGNSSALTPPKLSVSDPIGHAAANLPEPILPGEAVEGLELGWTDDTVTIRYEGASELAFYPAMESTSLISALKDGVAKGDTLSLHLASAERDLSKNEERRLVGVLAVVPEAGEPRWYTIDFGADGLRKPANADTIARVRDRVEPKPESGQ